MIDELREQLAEVSNHALPAWSLSVVTTTGIDALVYEGSGRPARCHASNVSAGGIASAADACLPCPGRALTVPGSLARPADRP